MAMFNRVAIIGLGSVGGSIGLALRNAKAAQQVTGYDLGKGVTDRARKIGAIDQACNALVDAVRGAELVILATPIGVMRSLLQDIASVASAGSVVTDVGSTKMQVISWAEEYLPTSIFFVGGHPLVSEEVGGIYIADATLFQNRIYCLTPTKRTSPAALNKVTRLIEVLGARVRFLEPAEHDGQFACVNQLPFVVSSVLMKTVAENAAWSDALLLSGSGLKEMTKLASSDPERYRDICLTNAEALSRCLSDYIRELSTFRDRLNVHDQGIIQIFIDAQQLLESWQAASDIL
jgi:prephenate dehydrogenase